MIELRDIHKAFGRNHVLNGVNLSIAKGESMVIIGGSGTGKSVLLKCILGIVTPDAGDILIDGARLKVIGQASKRVPVKKFIAHYESVISSARTAAAGKSARKPKAAKTAHASASKRTKKTPGRVAAKRKP